MSDPSGVTPADELARSRGDLWFDPSLSLEVEEQGRKPLGWSQSAVEWPLSLLLAVYGTEVSKESWVD